MNASTQNNPVLVGLVRLVRDLAKYAYLPTMEPEFARIAEHIRTHVQNGDRVGGFDRYELMDAAEECAKNNLPDLLAALLSVPMSEGFDAHFRQALRAAGRVGCLECINVVMAAWNTDEAAFVLSGSTAAGAVAASRAVA